MAEKKTVRTRNVAFRVTSEEYEQVEKLAAEAGKEFHEVGISVGNAEAHKDTDTLVGAFFGLVERLIKVIIKVPRTFLFPQDAVLDDIPVQSLIDRGKFSVRKSRAEKLMSGEAEKVRS